MRQPPTLPPGLDDVARLLAEPKRLRMLWAMGGGRAHTASELAAVAELAPSAASNHLARLVSAGFVAVRLQGRHRYYTVDREDIAQAVESLAAVAFDTTSAATPTLPRASPALRHARRCYGHLAGACGTGLWDGLLATGCIEPGDGGHRLADRGVAWMGALLADDGAAAVGHAVKPCLDWTERRWHLGGPLGRAVLSALQRDGVVTASPAGDRVLLVDPHRWRALIATLG